MIRQAASIYYSCTRLQTILDGSVYDPAPKPCVCLFIALVCSCPIYLLPLAVCSPCSPHIDAALCGLVLTAITLAMASASRLERLAKLVQTDIDVGTRTVPS